jgi:hypothetical protein
MKHTKGLWEVAELTPSKGTSYPCVMIKPHGTIIASCSNGTREETEANAQLISAAPEMLLALQRLNEWFETHGKDYEIGTPNCFLKAKTALNKVNGIIPTHSF